MTWTPPLEKDENPEEKMVCDKCGNDTLRAYIKIIIDDARFYCAKCGENAVVEIIDATCNICNTSCMKDAGNVKVFEGVEISADWGYFSKKDGEGWRAVVCEECADKYLKPLIKFDVSEK